MPQLLLVTSSGPADPTRASIAFHIATNGAAKAGIEAEIALTGDATDLLKPELIAATKGVGIPPLADLLQGCRDNGIRLHV